jgi:hypothetical protein
MSEWSVPFQFVVAVLATWRVAHLVAREDGPSDVIVWLRTRAGNSIVGRLTDCLHCVGLWVAMPFAWWLADTPARWLAAWLAIAGGASLAERFVERDSNK